MKCCFCKKKLCSGETIVYFTLGKMGSLHQEAKHSHNYCLAENSIIIKNHLREPSSHKKCPCCSKDLMWGKGYVEVYVYPKSVMQITEVKYCEECFVEMSGDDFFKD